MSALGFILRRINAASHADTHGGFDSIPHSHVKAHEGELFLAYTRDADLDIAGPIIVEINTPAASVGYVHFAMKIKVATAVTVNIDEGITTSDDGTAIGSINANRNETAPTERITTGPTITDPGTDLADFGIPAAGEAKFPFEARNEGADMVLKPSTKYSITITSVADNNIADVFIEWYVESTN